MSSSHAAAVPTPRAPLPRRGPAPGSDGLSTAQRRGVIGAIALVHVGAIWGVLQVPAVREAVMDAAPMFVELLAPPAPPAPPPPPVVPVVKAPPPVVIAAPAAAPSPANFEVAPPPAEPPPPAPPVVVQAVEAPPAPPAPPKMIPPSAVQYLEATPPEYPRTSRRLNEAGTATVRVYIDERGLPAIVQLSRSSGFARLDESALAAVKKWRFKPYSENGQPTAGYALIPVMFELEK
jgi:periplasmic protein TonB